MANKTLATNDGPKPIDVLRGLADSLPEAAEDEDLTNTMVGRILAAKDRAERLTPAKAPGLGDKEGAVYTVYALRKVEGGLNPDLGFFLLVDAKEEPDGERTAYSTGAARVVAALLADHRDGNFPCAYRIAHAASQKNPGRTVQWLVDPEAF